MHTSDAHGRWAAAPQLRSWAAGCAIAWLASGCFHPSYDRPACGPHGECPGGLVCGAQQICELPGSGSGSDDAGIDAPGMSTDASMPGPVCYGPSGWQVCLDAAATGQVQLSGSINTDASPQCLGTQPASWAAAQPAACIIVGDTVVVTTLSATGARPLVIVAQSQINVTGLLDIASHRSGGTVGAGSASAADCKPFGSSPGNGPPGGGGAGGSFEFPGGNGGTGDGTSKQGGQAAAADVGAPVRLRGGCAGQPGGGGKQSDEGAGGGAVYLVSAGTVSIAGKINASGAGGAGEDMQHGGGGGGSGGMIVLYASSVTTTSSTMLIADGGGGGGGSAQSGPTLKGTDGHEPVLVTPIAPALGGAGGVLVGANGGDGGEGYPATSNTMPGLMGFAGDQGAGGGGGGGGGGYIRSNQDLGMAAVSPAADIRP